MYIKDKKYNPWFDRVLIVVDVLMIVLVSINLLLLAIQVNFELELIRDFLRTYAPPIYELYLPVYENYFFIDLAFVCVYLTELFIRWAIAIYNKTYHRWFFYPFVQWYDVLGCLPASSFRLLRVFRIFSILIRLNRMKVIDIRQWYLYKTFLRYTNILTEEISDRVVSNVIEIAQDEVKQGIPLTARIVEEVVLPRKEILVNFIASQVQQIAQSQFKANEENLRESIRDSVTDAIRKNKNIKLLEQVPVVGKAASSAVQQAVYEITFQTIQNIFEKLSSGESRAMIENITDGTINTILTNDTDEELQRAVTDMVVHSLDLVKEHVQIQNWKLEEMREREKEKEEELAKRLIPEI